MIVKTGDSEGSVAGKTSWVVISNKSGFFGTSIKQFWQILITIEECKIAHPKLKKELACFGVLHYMTYMKAVNVE